MAFHFLQVLCCHYNLCISLNITGFGLNMYLTQFVYGAIEVPSKLIVYYLLERLADVKLKQELSCWLESASWLTYSYPKVRLQNQHMIMQWLWLHVQKYVST